MSRKFYVGQTVRALEQIFEDTGGDCVPDLAAKRLEPGWIHAQPGELGVVEGVEEDWYDYSSGEPVRLKESNHTPDVRFMRTGTATIVDGSSVEVVS